MSCKCRKICSTLQGLIFHKLPTPPRCNTNSSESSESPLAFHLVLLIFHKTRVACKYFRL